MSDDEHWYPNPDDANDLWPSVTTVLGATASKPQLQVWSAREAARYAIENHAEIGKLIAEGGADAAIRQTADAAKRLADTAADLGTLFHRLAEAQVKGQSVSVTEDEAEAIEPFLETLARFVDEMGPVYEWAEATVFHKRLRYAGTCDAGVRFTQPIPVIVGRELVDTFPKGVLLAADYKTGKRVWPEAVPQVTGYAMATHMDIKDGLSTVVPMPVVAGGVVIHIRPDAYRVHGVRVTPQVQAGFAHARRWFDVLRNEIPGQLGCGVRGDGLHLDDLPGLDVRVRNGLALLGVRTLAELEELGEVAFRAVKYAGPAAADTARQFLALEGRTWVQVAERGAA